MSWEQILAGAMARKEAEYKIQKGVRPGKAYKVAFPSAKDDTIKAMAEISKLSMTVTIEDNKESFINAYSQVKSCMQGKGYKVYQAYKNSNKSVDIACLFDKQGNIVARALIVGNEYKTIYGEYHYLLKGWLDYSGFRYKEYLFWGIEGCEILETVKEKLIVPRWVPLLILGGRVVRSELAGEKEVMAIYKTSWAPYID